MLDCLPYKEIHGPNDSTAFMFIPTRRSHSLSTFILSLICSLLLCLVHTHSITVRYKDIHLCNHVFAPALTQAACPSCAQCPCFNSAPYTFTISEDAAIGMEVGTITATPRNSFDLTYSTSSPSSSLFVIDSTTGVLTVGGSLDFESQESHAVTVIATDNDYESSERVTINILNINDNPPQCSLSVVYISLPENQSTASFQLPDCTDADSPANPVFSYEISGSLVDFFNVDANGNITLMRPLDFEERSLYDISIRINDTDIPPGSLSAWIRVIVTVEPVNEFSPVFADDVIAFAISESATVGSVVGRVSAVDEDSGRDGEVTYSISSVQTDAFIVNALTGDIILVSTLDYEQTTSYTLNVTATDSSTSSRISSAALITINVLDSNDNSPVYAQPVHYIEVAENSAPGSLLTQHSCTDLDSGVNKELVYSISSGNDRGIFDIDTSSGNVTLASAINYDSSPDSDFFRLTIQCEEVAPPNRLSETLLLVGVTSFNSYTPQPTDTEFEATVSEDTAPGTVLTQVQATDRDRGLDGTLRYYINYEGQLSTCPDDVVLVDESSGIVYLISPLDYETGIRDIYCMVTIWDSGYIRRSSEVDLIISVTDVNDELPRCDPTISTVYIEENANVGDTVFSVACNDVDSNILQYSIVSTQSLPFQIEPDGNIVLQSPLDYETEPFYLFSVQVSDGMFATNTTIRVTVGNVNEYSPTFSQETYHCSLLENTPIGETISCDFNAVDNDSSMEGEVRYRLVSVSNLFQLSPEGHLVLAAPHVDLTAQSDYLLEIEAYDLGSPSLSSRTFINLTVLDVNDNAPSMPRLLFASIPENSSPSTTITTVMCTDVDEGLNGEVELSIVHVSRLAENGYLNVTELQLYNIDPANGELSVRGGLDFETARQYKLTILCRDQGTPSLSSVTSLFIEILPQNEYPPVVTLPSDTLLVPEATSIGTSLLTIQATDEDHGADGVVHFSLSPVSGHAPFEINRRSGVIVLSGPLDCDRTVQYELMVEVEDRGQPKRSTQASLTVNITTCHLGSVEPNSYAYALSVPENAPVGESVGTVSCSSTRMNVLTDINPVYQIISGGNGHFEIDSLSGEITVSDSPDYEIQTAHQLMIECYDPNHQHIADTFTAFINVLPINEFTPMFSESSFRVNVSEDALLGDFVLQLEAIDRDSGQDGELLFSIVGQDSSAFLIDQHTGRVYLAASLDREAVDELTFTASAQDLTTDVALRRSAGTTVTVSVTDINDNSPQCEHVVHHLIVSPRTTAPHTLVSDFACTDADTNQNSDLTYEFSDTSVPENLFEIDSRQLLLRNNLDSSGPPHYYLPVRVQDGGSPSLATNLLVIIEVQEPDIDESGVDLLSQVKEEGLKNTVWIRMEGLSIESVNFTHCTLILIYMFGGFEQSTRHFDYDCVYFLIAIVIH